MRKVPAASALLLAALNAAAAAAFVPTSSPSSSYHPVRFGGASASASAGTALHSFAVPGMWKGGNAFGKGGFRFYESFDSWMSPFADEDRAAYPEIFTVPDGVYEVGLPKPLGVVFEEIDAGGGGVYVQDLVEGGNAQCQGRIRPGDVLVGITAVKVVGAKWERRLIPARKFDFDTVVGAIGSNEPKWGCKDVVCMFERPEEAEREKTDAFMEFFEPPFDNPWKQQQ